MWVSQFTGQESLAVLGEGLLELLHHGRHARPRELKLLLELAVAVARLGRRLLVVEEFLAAGSPSGADELARVEFLRFRERDDSLRSEGPGRPAHSRTVGDRLLQE